MKNIVLTSLAAFALSAPAAAPAAAQDEAPAKPALGPADIVNAAPQEDWVVIAPEDMVVMTLAPDRDGKTRQVVIQLMPVSRGRGFSQGWVENIRTLARAGWYDGISVNRVQDNYVVQWGDPGHDNPEGEGLETKPLPEGLRVMTQEDYTRRIRKRPGAMRSRRGFVGLDDPYSEYTYFVRGFAMASSPVLEIDGEGRSYGQTYPVHCYGMVGVGRNYSPDTGSGAELYTVIGHAPRHLDRNIALVGRIIGGMEHLSSLPRGSGVLGFYTEEEADKRTPILSVRVASDLPEAERPAFEYLSTETETFAKYAEARTNRRDPFFIVPAGGADICNIPVPIREVADAGDQ